MRQERVHHTTKDAGLKVQRFTVQRLAHAMWEALSPAATWRAGMGTPREYRAWGSVPFPGATSRP
jgi:hypothetical protein